MQDYMDFFVLKKFFYKTNSGREGGICIKGLLHIYEVSLKTQGDYI